MLKETAEWIVAHTEVENSGLELLHSGVARVRA